MKMKTENKAGHISALRSLIPHITGSNGHYPFYKTVNKQTFTNQMT